MQTFLYSYNIHTLHDFVLKNKNKNKMFKINLTLTCFIAKISVIPVDVVVVAAVFGFWGNENK